LLALAPLQRAAARVLRRKLAQLDLGVDELGALRLAVLLQPVGKDEPDTVIVRGVFDRLGIRLDQEMHDAQGRPYTLCLGKPVRALF